MKSVLYWSLVCVLYFGCCVIVHIVQYQNKYHNRDIRFCPSVWNVRKVWQ